MQALFKSLLVLQFNNKESIKLSKLLLSYKEKKMVYILLLRKLTK